MMRKLKPRATRNRRRHNLKNWRKSGRLKMVRLRLVVGDMLPGGAILEPHSHHWGPTLWKIYRYVQNMQIDLHRLYYAS